MSMYILSSWLLIAGYMTIRIKCFCIWNLTNEIFVVRILILKKLLYKNLKVGSQKVIA